MLKIDVFCHIFPPRYWQVMTERVAGSAYMQKRVRGIPTLHDLDLRFRLLERYPGYVQVLSLAAPPIEALASPTEAASLARLANEGLAELCQRYPERFVGFVASLPMNDPKGMIEEARYAIDEHPVLGLTHMILQLRAAS